MGVLSVGQVADYLSKTHGVTIEPRTVTLLFYQRRLREDLCPILKGRRLIPVEYVPMIEAELRRAGKLQKVSA